MPRGRRPRPNCSGLRAALPALGPGGGLARHRQIVLVAADDVGDHVAHLRVLDAAGLLQGGELVLQPRLELRGRSGIPPAISFGLAPLLLDLLGDAL